MPLLLTLYEKVLITSVKVLAEGLKLSKKKYFFTHDYTVDFSNAAWCQLKTASGLMRALENP